MANKRYSCIGLFNPKSPENVGSIMRAAGCYGVSSVFYTGSLRNALRLSREIRAGVVTVNCFGEGDASTPFGGYKESGFGGRDKSIWAHDQYTELKTIWINAA